MGGSKSRVRYHAPKRGSYEMRDAMDDYRRVRDQPVLPPTRERRYREPIGQHCALVDAQNAIREDRQERLAAARQRITELLPDYHRRMAPARARSDDARWTGRMYSAPSYTPKRGYEQGEDHAADRWNDLQDLQDSMDAMDQDDGYDGRAPAKRRSRAMPYAGFGSPGEAG